MSTISVTGGPDGWTLCSHKPRWEPAQLAYNAAGDTKPGYTCTHELENGNGPCGGNVFNLEDGAANHSCWVGPHRTVTLSGGQTIYRVHFPQQCAGHTCAIHNPSPHVLVEFPQHFDNDTGAMLRMCRHHLMHPDADDLGFRLRSGGILALMVYGEHDCDGCCMTPEKRKELTGS